MNDITARILFSISDRKRRKRQGQNHLRLIDIGTVAMDGTPFAVTPKSERRLAGRVAGNGSFF